MEPSEYHAIAKHQDTNFYYVGNRRIITSLIQHYVHPRKRLRILDAGCGTGHMTKDLARMGRVSAIDVHPLAVQLARDNGIDAQRGSVNQLPYRANTFDLAVSLDVIYHRQVDDAKALVECFRVLKPGGILLLRVPAHPFLTTYRDQRVHGRERYTKSTLRERLTAAGFTIAKLSYVNVILFPFLWAAAARNHLLPPNPSSSNVVRVLPPLNRLLTFLLTLESRLLPYGNFPLGVGLVAVATKPTRP